MTERDEPTVPPPDEADDALYPFEPKDDDLARHLAPGRSGGTGT